MSTTDSQVISSISFPPSIPAEKCASIEDGTVTIQHVNDVRKSERLHRRLASRHLSMIAIGGALGTGLLIGTGTALEQGGPGAILITYSLVGCVVYMMMCALGEMATWLPIPSGFQGHATRFVDPAMGFALGYTYWFKYIILSPNQVTAAALIIQYWVSPDKVNPGVFITIFLVALFIINYFGVRLFGEFEFWLSSFKIIVVVGLLLLLLVLTLGGGPDHDRKGFRYWSNPGAFHAFIKGGSAGNFLTIVSSLTTSTFAFLGTELIGVTVGEAENPRRDIPRAVKLTFFRIVFFYVFGVLLLGMNIPYNAPALIVANGKATSASASPFIVAMQSAGVTTLPGIMNACLLFFIFSAANSDLYIASRTIYGLAVEGSAFRILAHTDSRGVPIYSLCLSASFLLLAFLSVSESSATIFKYFVNLVTVFGIMTWISIFIAHICFRRARRAQGIADSALVYVAPLGVHGSWFGLGVCTFIAIFKNYSVFIHSSVTGGSYGSFDYKTFITGYLGIPLYFAMYIGHKLVFGHRPIDPLTADLHSGKEAIDNEEAEFLANREANGGRARGWYKLVSWLF
ncbi:dicarboxylic amino acid permease [Mariannaea sp. PMI_226]|nr:dicarboxylic amino acid permease [Mariannaea sp. PMI_226]